MKALKKILLVLAAILGLFVLAAVIIPLVVNVDRYRPQIVEMANQRLNGKLELGKLSLSLWGKLRVEVGGLSVLDAGGRKVLGVNQAYLNVPFSSILGGSPDVVLKMEKPAVNVIKDKNGQLNVLNLMKPSEAPPAQAQPTPGASPQPQVAAPPSRPEDREFVVPSIVKKARLSVELQGANVLYQDFSAPADAQLETRVEDLNLRVRDISLSRPMDIELWAELNTRFGKLFTLQGPARLKGQAEVVLAGQKVDRFNLTSKLDLDGVDVAVAPFFHKEKGIAANVDLAASFSEKALVIQRLDARFFNAEIRSKGTVQNMGVPGASPQVQFEAKSNEIDLKPWSQLVPMLKDYELGGNAKLDAEVNGPAERLAYQALLTVAGLTAKAPHLKTQPRFDATVKVLTDRIEDLRLTMKAPGNDLTVHGKLLSFTAPKLTLEATSPGLDLDQLIEFPQKGTAEKAAPAGAPAPKQAAAPAASPAVATAEAPGDYDAMLDPLRKNELMQALTANASVDLKMVKAYGVKMTDVVGQFAFKNLVAFINSASFRVFGGIIQANGAADLKPARPTYRYAAQLSGVDISEAVASQFQLFKNTVLGKAQMEMKGEGTSFNPKLAIDALKAKGKLRVEQATFATIDVGKLATEALNQAIDRAAEKVPPLKGRKVNGLPGGESKYEFIASDFAIEGGKFIAPNLVAKAVPNRGIDLKGSTAVGLKDYALKSSWEISDTYNLTKARDLSVPVAGAQVEHILAEGNNPVRFPVNVNCTVMAPCYSYGEVPEYLAKVALNNLSRAAQGKAKEELRKQAEKLIPKNLPKEIPPQVEEKLKDFGKKLFGR